MLIVLTPHGQRLYGSLDRSMGHNAAASARGNARRDTCSNPRAFAWEESLHFTKAGARPAGGALTANFFGSTKISRLVLEDLR
jgi:hypothetical protein